MKLFAKILLCLISGLALNAGLCADEVVTNNNLSGNPFAEIVQRNVFNLNPVTQKPTVDPNNLPLKITPSGIQNFFGTVQVLFKTSEAAKPGQKAKDKYYMLSEGQRQDDIEVVKIDQQNEMVTFRNHGTVQELPLVADSVGKSKLPPPPNSRPGTVIPGRTGGTRGSRHEGFNPFNRRGRTSSNGQNGGSDNNPAIRSIPTRTYQPPQTGLTPQQSAILIEEQRAKMLDAGNPAAKLLPPTKLTSLVTGQEPGAPPIP